MSKKMTRVSLESLRPITVLYEGDIHEFACLLLKLRDYKDREANARKILTRITHHTTVGGLATAFSNLVQNISEERVKQILLKHGLPLDATVEQDDVSQSKMPTGLSQPIQAGTPDRSGKQPATEPVRPAAEASAASPKIPVAKKKPKQRSLAPSSRTAGTGQAVGEKSRVEAMVQELIDKELKPKHVQPPPNDARFNYLTDIKTQWHGTTLFLVSVYACPGPNAIAPTFEERFARLKPAGQDRFDLAFMRHTGQWVELFQGLTLEKCLQGIKDDPWFTP